MENKVIILGGAVLAILLVGAIIFASNQSSYQETLATGAPSETIDETPKPVGEESLFAELDANDVVVRVLVISAENVATGKWGDPNNFVRTSNKNSIRGLYAGVGYTYDRAKDEFIPPAPIDAISYDNAKKEWIRPEPLQEQMIKQ